MRSFLRIDGDEFALRGGRVIWFSAQSDGVVGIAFQLVAHGSRNMLHLAGWVPGSRPEDLSGAELTVTEAGCEAALDGHLFGAVLIRFGRVDEERAIVSVDGDVESLDPDSEARSLVAADVDCSMVEADAPAFCNHCGTTLEGEAVRFSQYIGGRLITHSRPRPTCRSCAESTAGLEPPQRCSTCGAVYEPDGMEWAMDEVSLAYTCTCPHGHTVAGTSTRAA